MSEITLTREGFEAWLKSLPPARIIGFRRSPCKCPLAAYLKSQGARDPDVTAAWYKLDWQGKSPAIDIPRWAQCFVHAVDSGEKGTAITARMALGLLRGISPAPR